ncbi:hypothetical protein MXB_2236, partial [Myxobolus squamalis]
KLRDSVVERLNIFWLKKLWDEDILGILIKQGTPQIAVLKSGFEVFRFILVSLVLGIGKFSSFIE